MPDGLDWLYAPLRAKMCLYPHLIDGTLDLADIAEMNDILSVDAENMRRAQAAGK